MSGIREVFLKVEGDIFETQKNRQGCALHLSLETKEN